MRDNGLILIRRPDSPFSIDLVCQAHGYLSSAGANPEFHRDWRVWKLHVVHLAVSAKFLISYIRP